MASIRKEPTIDARPEDVWAALRDVGALHTRLVPGFVVDTRLEDGARIVTFGNGMVGDIDPFASAPTQRPSLSISSSSLTRGWKTAD